MTVTAIILAAGRGTRAGGEIPKQFQMVGGTPVIERTVESLRTHSQISNLILVINPQDRIAFRDELASLADCTLVDGGNSRDQSVRAGLAALPKETTRVLIHDGARPFVSPDVIDRVLVALCNFPGAAPALPVTDALWRGSDGMVRGTQDRAGLWRAQTPQGFQADAIKSAHSAWNGTSPALDDVEVARAHGLDVAIVEGEEDNLKITHPPDFARAEAILSKRRAKAQSMDIRTGNGFDVHAFEPGDHVTLCGVCIPHSAALKGHSDADVGMHAITDAIYGALAMGDIGQHFPPSDPQWKGAASEIFLHHAVELAKSNGFAIANLDCTLICERPKVGPHANAMRDELARITQVSVDRISVKATTSERLGFTGREEGIAALASCTLLSA